MISTLIINNIVRCPLLHSICEVSPLLRRLHRRRTEIRTRAECVCLSTETRYIAGDISFAVLLPIRRDWTSAWLDLLEALHEGMQVWAALSPYAW
jgi:hypothetical protein